MAYSTIDTSASDNTFSGALEAVAAGQYTINVRVVGQPETEVSVTYVGIGDIFIVAGQSNAIGQATNLQVSTHATLRAGLYTRSNLWVRLVDDMYSTGWGSPWPLVATAYMADLSVPCAFVPCAVSNTGIASWLPTGDNYVAMKTRALVTGAKVVLWWQGEYDVIYGTNQTTYNGHLDTIANAVASDLGCKLMPCKIQNLTTYDAGYDNTAVNAAIAEAWSDNANVLTGPDLSSLTPGGDGLHFRTDAEMATVAAAWWSAIETAFSW